MLFSEQPGGHVPPGSFFLGTMKIMRFISTTLLVTTVLSAQQPTVALHEQKAQQYLRTHQPQQALREFQEVVSAEPNNMGALANLGVLEYFAGDVTNAEKHLRSAIALDPNQPKLQALLGFSEHRLGQLEDARRDLLASFPHLVEPKVQKQAGLELLEIDTALNDLPAAAPIVLQLRTLLPDDPEVQYASYRVFNDLAGQSLLELSVIAPQSAQMHQAMAFELSRARDNNGVITNLRAALKTDPTLPGAHFQLAQALEASPEEAVKAQAGTEYKLALQQSPNDDAVLVRLGDLASAAEDRNEATRRYRQALAIRPTNAEAALGLAYQLSETGHPDQALPLLTGVIQADPSNMLAHFRLSAVYRRLQRPEDAKREVVEYGRLKTEKDNLRALYESMRVSPPQNAVIEQKGSTDVHP